MTLDDLLDILGTGYGSIETPNYSRINANREGHEITLAVTKLITHFHYKDVSDNNYDVSVILESLDLPLSHTIFLSLVGQIAYIHPDDSNARNALSHIRATLVDLGWTFIERHQLLLPAPFQTDLAGADTIFFHILFSDSYLIPI